MSLWVYDCSIWSIASKMSKWPIIMKILIEQYLTVVLYTIIRSSPCIIINGWISELTEYYKPAWQKQAYRYVL